MFPELLVIAAEVSPEHVTTKVICSDQSTVKMVISEVGSFRVLSPTRVGDSLGRLSITSVDLDVTKSIGTWMTIPQRLSAAYSATIAISDWLSLAVITSLAARFHPTFSSLVTSLTRHRTQIPHRWAWEDQSHVSFREWSEWPWLLSWLEARISPCQGLWCNLPPVKLAPIVIDRPYVNATCLITRYDKHSVAYARTHSTTRAHATVQQVLNPCV